MTALSEKEESVQRLSTTFDVNSFLRKTLSDFQTESRKGEKPARHPHHEESKGRALRDPQKLNRNLVEIRKMYDDKDGTRNSGPEPCEFSQLIPERLPEEDLVPQNSRTSEIPVKLKKQRKMAQCPSRASLSSASPLCRICQMVGDTEGGGDDQLISPCRCSGTMQFVHTSCLVVGLYIMSVSGHSSVFLNMNSLLALA